MNDLVNEDLAVEMVSDLELTSTAVYDRRFSNKEGGYTFRYSLTREWHAKGLKGKLVFVMLNGSTATAFVNDPTVRRCMGWAQKWKYKALEVVNLFAFRSLDPKVMKAAPDPVGPLNDGFIRSACMGADLVICAWGVHGAFMGRGEYVRRTLLLDRQLYYLKRTADGHPSHPLYLRGDSAPIPWRD